MEPCVILIPGAFETGKNVLPAEEIPVIKHNNNAVSLIALMSNTQFKYALYKNKKLESS
jgi:hypothetical protein